VADLDELAERGTVEFCREQVSRLVRLAETLNDPASRIELLDTAAVFQKMADRIAASVINPGDVAAKKSA
jgi:hypothetical protein